MRRGPWHLDWNLKRVSAHRVEAQQQMLEVFKRLHRKDRFDRRIAKLFKRVRLRGKHKGMHMSFSEWARLRFQPIVSRFFEAGRADLSVNDKLHQFRLKGKKLRYAMELLAAAFPDELRSEVYPLLSELQDKLGEINDHATAETRIQHWIEEDDKPKEVEYLHHILEGEQQQMKERRDTFFAWWIPDRVQQMQAAFDKMFQPDGTNENSGKVSPDVASQIALPESNSAS